MAKSKEAFEAISSKLRNFMHLRGAAHQISNFKSREKAFLPSQRRRTRTFTAGPCESSRLKRGCPCVSKVKLFSTKTVTQPSFPRGKLQGVASIPLFKNSPRGVYISNLTSSPCAHAPHGSFFITLRVRAVSLRGIRSMRVLRRR